MVNKSYFLLAMMLAFVGISCSANNTNATPVISTTVPVTEVSLMPSITPSPTLLPTLVFSQPTPIPYPTASSVKTNAVAFIDLTGIDDSLWVANVDGSGERKLVDIENNASRSSNYLLRWSPNGKWISYVSGDDLWIISPDGSVKKKILSVQETSRKIIRRYEWSPDSSKIAYAQATNWGDGAFIVIRLLDVATEEISEIASYRSPFTITLSWSPNGRYLLLSRESSFFVLEVDIRKNIREIETGNERLTGGGCLSSWHDGVVWSPDGEWFYHAHHGTGGSGVWTCISGLDGSNRQIHVDGAASLPVWDKTGDFLYFASQTNNPNNDPNLDTDYQLIRYDVTSQTTESMHSFREKASRYSYVWTISMSPDRRTLVMNSRISENQQTFIFLDLDSLSTRKLDVSEIPHTPGNIMWSADNQSIIFLSDVSNRFCKLDVQPGEPILISGSHAVQYWVISPVISSP